MLTQSWTDVKVSTAYIESGRTLQSGWYGSYFVSCTNVQFAYCSYGILCNQSITLENSLVSHCQFLGDAGNLTANNVTFDHCEYGILYAGSAQLTNCLFSDVANIVWEWGDSGPVDGSTDYEVDGSNNGFNNLDKVFGDNPQFLDVGYQTGPLGDYYLSASSDCVDYGTTTADRLGLYYYTTQTNQAIEGITLVDLGYHYPAVDSNGNPVSTEVPGVPDYISDPNGQRPAGLMGVELVWQPQPVRQ
jgi:hypothetical protein